MKRAYDGSDSSIGRRVSSSFTSRRRNVWNVSYHSRSQCVWGTIATVMGGRSLICSSSSGSPLPPPDRPVAFVHADVRDALDARSGRLGDVTPAPRTHPRSEGRGGSDGAHGARAVRV